ncbi:MAG TPA: glycoside hydrolase family 3 C-terminal domain-containing protein [Acidimicrobiales bacterium]
MPSDRAGSDPPLTGAQPVEHLVTALTLDEKASLTAGADLWSTVAIERLGIPKVWMTDGPNGARGPSLPGEGSAVSTCVPCGTALAATWNPALIEEVGALLGGEARRKGCRILLAPTVNMHRSPLAGRNFECYSEDPLLAGKVAAAFIRGVQSRGVAATVKHFAGNEAESERMTVSSEIDERTLREIYLLPFELAVREGGTLGVMTAYNRLNGRYCSEQAELLTGMLRDEWGFEGVVMTDWFALGSTVGSARAGLDLEMPGPGRIFGPALAAAVRAGQVEESTLDGQIRRLLTVMARVGCLDDAPAATPAGARRSPGAAPTSPTVPTGPDSTRTGTAAGLSPRALPRVAAAEAIVLLANNGVLPIDPTTLRTVAVVGPNADRAQIMGGGSAALNAEHLITPLDAVRARLGDSVVVVHEPGCAVVRTTPPFGRAGPEPPRPPSPSDPELLGRAAAAVAAADIAVVVVGTDDTWESEGRDRASMALPGAQDELVRRLTEVDPNVVVVVNAGAPVSMDWAGRAGAVLQVWFGGQDMAEALVDVLTGATDPGGRLPVTLPERIEHSPAFGNFPGQNGRIRYGEGVLVGYRWYEARHLPVRFPFGHGLSFTSFVIGPPRSSSPAGTGTRPLVIEVPVTNTGRRGGAEVVQCYVEPAPARLPRPAKELKAFTKLWADPGQTVLARLELDDRAFAYWDPGDGAGAALRSRVPSFLAGPDAIEHRARAGWYIDGGDYRLHIGRSSADIAHVITVTVGEAGGAQRIGPD